jgi:hypothetical protein
VGELLKLILTQNNPKLAQLILGQLNSHFTFVVLTKKTELRKTFPSHNPAEYPVGLQLSDLVGQN